MKRLVLTLMIVPMFAASMLFAATVQVSWNANLEPDMASYKVYEGTQLIGTVTHPLTSLDIVNVTDGTHTYQVTAIDQSGNESERSDPATIKIDTSAPSKPQGLKVIIKK